MLKVWVFSSSNFEWSFLREVVIMCSGLASERLEPASAAALCCLMTSMIWETSEKSDFITPSLSLLAVLKFLIGDEMLAFLLGEI